MTPHTRAMIAAIASAAIGDHKVAGLFDHTAGRHLRIAAECRGAHLQGYDEGRSARFGGTLPEIFDAGDRVYVSVDIAGNRARGFDRGSSSAFTAEVAGRSVQVYDHAAERWFAYDVNVA